MYQYVQKLVELFAHAWLTWVNIIATRCKRWGKRSTQLAPRMFSISSSTAATVARLSFYKARCENRCRFALTLVSMFETTTMYGYNGASHDKGKPVVRRGRKATDLP